MNRELHRQKSDGVPLQNDKVDPPTLALFQDIIMNMNCHSAWLGVKILDHLRLHIRR